MAKLGDLTTVISSGATPLGGAENYMKDGPVLFIRSQNVLMNDLNTSTAVYIEEAFDRQLARTRVVSGDVLLNITGASIGRVTTFLIGGVRANVNQHVCVIRPKPQMLFGPFLSRYIATPEFQTHINGIQAGGTRQALNFSQIAEFDVPLPPLVEQRRIAAILDKADALRQKRRLALKKLGLLTQSIFFDMFGDSLREDCMPVRELHEVCKRITDGTHQPPKWAPEGIPFLFVSNVRGGKIDFVTEKFISIDTYNDLTRNCPIEEGDVLYTTVGSYGNSAVVPNEQLFAFQRHIAHLKPNTAMILPEFLAIMLEASFVRRQADQLARGIAQKTLNLSEIRSFKVLVPDLKEQDRFVRLTKCVAARKGLLKDSERHHDELFNSLEYRAFRGEL